MTYIEELIKEINITHNGLGELVAMSHIAVKARKFMLIVSPSGCGKSRVMEFIGKNTPKSYSPSSISTASLSNKVELLTGFRSVIVVDDIANIQTSYSRTSTINTLSMLCYSHRVEPSMYNFDFCLEDFYGSALIGIQPILLRDLMLSPEWEASIQDKALRYYHLRRPLNPNLTMPSVKLEHGIPIENIKTFEPDIKSKYWRHLVNLGDAQWSRARTKEHLIDMLKAIAAIERRKEVIEYDYIILAKLLKPMAIENVVVTKEQLEGERYLDNNLLALLAEYYSYSGQYSLAQVALDFKLSLSQAYRIMSSQANGRNSNWQQISKSPTIYKASEKLIKALENFGLEIKDSDNSKG